jgi:hypothetical protein
MSCGVKATVVWVPFHKDGTICAARGILAVEAISAELPAFRCPFAKQDGYWSRRRLVSLPAAGRKGRRR